MSLTTAEIESLRFHLGYGNLSAYALPYTPDGFWEVFNSIVAPYLSTGTETSATTAITAASTTTVTPLSMTSIVANARLVVDVGDLAETVVVKSVTATTFTAYFANAHPTSGYPISTECGVARLRVLLHSAEKAWKTLQSASITQTAGIKQLGQGEIEWFEGGAVYDQTLEHYYGIVNQISSLVRVPVNHEGNSRATTLEAY